MRLPACASGVLLAASIASAQEPAPIPRPGAPVRVGGTVVLRVAVGDGVDLPSRRAERASAALAAALADPLCGPSGFGVEHDGERPVVAVCGQPVLAIGDADIDRPGLTPDDLAREWAAALRAAFATEKEVAYSSRLVRRAILGLILPCAFLGLGLLLRTGSRRIRERLAEPQAAGAGLRVGRLRLLSSRAERIGVAQAVRLATWIGYLVLAYALLVILFRQFPATGRWAARMLEPFGSASDRLGLWVPVVALVVLGLVGLRVALALIGRVFEQVRAGQLRFEPLLSREASGSAEFLARTIAVAVTLLYIGWVVPGELGLVIQVAAGVVALALAAGAWDASANLVAGFVVLYGRPVRRGQRVRVGAVEGIVREKRLLHMKLETDAGPELLLPNRLLLREPVAIVRAPDTLRLRMVLRSPKGLEAALGLVRHATATSGLKRDEVRPTLVAVRDGLLVVDAEWACAGDRPAALRHRLLESLLACADGLDVEVVTADQSTAAP